MPPSSTSLAEVHHTQPHDEECPFCQIVKDTPAHSQPLSPDAPVLNTDLHPSSSSSSNNSPVSHTSAATIQPSESIPNPSASSTHDPSAGTSGLSSPFSHPSPSAHILLSTPTVIAILDHAPLAKGHVLLLPRAHRVKASDVRVSGEAEALGRWVGVLGRAVVRAVARLDHAEEDEGDGEVGDWNVVQNNGPRAAQVVPHVHYHIIPRLPFGSADPVAAKSWTVFGRGQREDLDPDEGDRLTRAIRREIAGEVERVRRREGEEVLSALFEMEERFVNGEWERVWCKL